MFMKTQQVPTAQVIIEIIDRPGASLVKALITTLGPAGVLPNVLRPSVGINLERALEVACCMACCREQLLGSSRIGSPAAIFNMGNPAHL
jgi:hypothetical protein